MAAESRTEAARTATRGRRVVLWWLLAAMLFAQTLGLMHRVVHPGFAAPPGAQAVALQASAAAATSLARPGDGIAKLFAHDDAGCRLFDQASHGAPVLEVPALALPLALVATVFAWLEGQACAREAASFDARGPPSVR